MCENTLPLNLNVRIVGIERIDVNDITARGIGEPIQKANPLVNQKNVEMAQNIKNAM